MQATITDLSTAVRAWRLWGMLGWLDVRQRYRRAVLGPFWITISMAVMISMMGVIYGALFNQQLESFLPFLAASFIVWFFISSTITEGSLMFIQAESMIKQGGLPLALHAFRIIWRNLIIMAHNALIMIGVYVIFFEFPGWPLLGLIPGMALLLINMFWVLLIVGPMCTRYRDLQPIVANMLQIAFFVTPIMFKPTFLTGDLAWLVHLNQLHYVIESIRSPLLGQWAPTSTVITLLCFSVIGSITSVVFFQRVRPRIAYWL